MQTFLQRPRDSSGGLHGVLPLVTWLSNVVINPGAVMTVTWKGCSALEMVLSKRGVLRSVSKHTFQSNYLKQETGSKRKPQGGG